MSGVAFPIVWAIGVLVFAVIIAGRVRLLLQARPASRFDHFGARLRRALVDGVGQRKFLSGEQPAGVMHALIFWGFLVLMLQVVRLYVRAFDANWDLPAQDVFAVSRDVVEVIVAVGVLYMLYRRLIAHTPRLFGLRGAPSSATATRRTGRASLILVFILLIDRRRPPLRHTGVDGRAGGCTT